MSVLLDPSALRRDYKQRTLLETEAGEDPFLLFQRWFQEALDAHAQKILIEPNAMVLSTVSPEGQPRGRFVLLKGVDDRGFVFFTNYESAKAHQLHANPRACLTFGWLELERQVCIEGTAVKIDPSETAAYFHSRPRGSQLGAWASPQSQVIPNRAALDQRLVEVSAQFPEQTEIPVPPHWGGYRVEPTSIEFWQGRSSRLHDRLRFVKQSEKTWRVERLAS